MCIVTNSTMCIVTNLVMGVVTITRVCVCVYIYICKNTRESKELIRLRFSIFKLYRLRGIKESWAPNPSSHDLLGPPTGRNHNSLSACSINTHLD